MVDGKVGIKGCGIVGGKFKFIGICCCLGVLNVVVYKFFVWFKVGLRDFVLREFC